MFYPLLSWTCSSKRKNSCPDKRLDCTFNLVSTFHRFFPPSFTLERYSMRPNYLCCSTHSQRLSVGRKTTADQSVKCLVGWQKWKKSVVSFLPDHRDILSGQAVTRGMCVLLILGQSNTPDYRTTGLNNQACTLTFTPKVGSGFPSPFKLQQYTTAHDYNKHFEFA